MSRPSHQSTDGFQPRDSEDVDEAVQKAIEHRLERRFEFNNRQTEVIVRKLLRMADDALAGEGSQPPEPILETIHRIIRDDDRIDDLLRPQDDRLDRATKYQFRQQCRLRDNGKHPPADREHATLVKISKALEYIYAYSDTSRYAPVRFERLDVQGGASSTSGPITPIGRRRVGREELVDTDEIAPTINHDDCEHVLAVALPRKGKDSMIASMCGNLKDEHGYKWFSCFDDGRNETPMIAIPSDDPNIRRNLSQFGQEPKGYDTVVYVPATTGLPDKLPSNFEPFTIGIDDLTPKLVLQLAGVTTDDSNTMRRVGQALSEVQDGSGSVEDLVNLLKEYADEVEATITVSELQDDQFEETEDGERVVADADDVEATGGEIREMHYQMDADDLLEDCADALMMLAGEGLIADSDASTNLDIEAEFRKDRVAVLNCNFLLDRNEVLRYLVLNLWLRLIFQARDDNPRLPRAALEIRELKNVAPSKLGQTDHRGPIKAVRNTIYEIATQGGSRRVMMLGSTQKLNEVSKAIRTNMPIKILLQLGSEEIDSLDRSYGFKPEQKRQLEEFDVGWGMLLAHGKEHWPIQWRGARCGLGLGDAAWRDRYAKAWGARVREYDGDGWLSKHGDKDAWIDVWTGEVRRLDRASGDLPELGQWHLFPPDVEAVLDSDERVGREVGEQIEDDLIREAVRNRREYDPGCDLSLTTVDAAAERELSFVGADRADAERKNRILSEYSVPRSIASRWVDCDPGMRKRMLAILDTIDTADTHPIRSYDDLARETGASKTAISNYMQAEDELQQTVKKNDSGAYELTEIGREALRTDWEKLGERLDAE